MDTKNVIKIPQNATDFFLINEHETWDSAINISFNMEKNIDFLNLFLLIKSYVLSQTNPPYAIATSFFDENAKMIITQKENIYFFKKISYDSFLEWIAYRIKFDWKYNKSEHFYSLIVLFDRQLTLLNNEKTKLNVLKYYKPVYPWSDAWLNFNQKTMEEVIVLKKKIEILEKKLKDTTKL